MSGYAVVRVEEVPEHDDGQVPMRLVRHHLGITGFGVNAWTAHNVGDRLIPEHQEADESEDESERNEELYVVVQGRAVFELDGERHDAPAGTLVFARPRVNRTAFAEEPGTVILAVGGTPGKAYDPVGWELWYSLRRMYERGEHAAVVEGARRLIEANPGSGLLFYNLACCESLTGETSEALEHLRSAIELSERFREYAEKDSDLDAIRDEPAFQELVGSSPAT
jgi:mannose-6-phosphate isomerase-like protein (cupin superfamily)